MSAAALPLAKAASLWAEWKYTHEACNEALASAANIAERLEVLAEDKVFERLQHQQEVQHQVIAKQLTSFNKALALVHTKHNDLNAIVRDLEKMHIEASRTLSSVSNLEAVAVQNGPQLSAVECAELLHDVWVMCRNELLMKFAAVSLMTLDMQPADWAALLSCYRDQPNIEVDKVDAMFALLQEIAPPRQHS